MPVNIAWSASPDNVLEYRIYRKAQASSDYVHVTTTANLSVTGITGTTNDNYMVRAVKFETSNSGTYYNASQGVFYQD